MRKPISRKMHGPLADHPFAAAVAAAPRLARFEDEKQAAALCRIMAGAAGISSILTRAEWGALRVMPFKAHLALDVLTSLTALTAPWVLGFSNNARARNTFLAMAAFGLVMTSLTRVEEMSDP